MESTSSAGEPESIKNSMPLTPLKIHKTTSLLGETRSMESLRDVTLSRAFREFLTEKSFQVLVFVFRLKTL
jgi:hypothetical protein